MPLHIYVTDLVIHLGHLCKPWVWHRARLDCRHHLESEEWFYFIKERLELDDIKWGKHSKQQQQFRGLTWRYSSSSTWPLRFVSSSLSSSCTCSPDMASPCFWNSNKVTHLEILGHLEDAVRLQGYPVKQRRQILVGQLDPFFLNVEQKMWKGKNETTILLWTNL